MKRFVFLGFALFLGLPVLAGVNNVESTYVETASSVANASTRAASQLPEGSSSQMMQPAQSAQSAQPVKQDTAEEKAYKAKMIKMSGAIAEKIKQIQTKQKEIDTEVYPASKPPLVADRVILEAQLRELEMERDRMQTLESSRKMTQDLKNNTSRTP
jgi:hypothetical protein